MGLTSSSDLTFQVNDHVRQEDQLIEINALFPQFILRSTQYHNGKVEHIFHDTREDILHDKHSQDTIVTDGTVIEITSIFAIESMNIFYPHIYANVTIQLSETNHLIDLMTSDQIHVEDDYVTFINADVTILFKTDGFVSWVKSKSEGITIPGSSQFVELKWKIGKL
jgi:hypothetical protein